MNQLGAFQAFKTGSSLSSEASAEVEKVCPFSDSSANEDQLSKQFLPQATKPHARIGGYLDCYVGRVSDPVLYGKSSSGGVGRWILSELLNAGDVTAVIQVVESFGKDPSELLYKYSVCTTQEEVQSAGKSAYYPVELSGVVKYILEHPGKYAITGVPCFVKAIRGIARINSVFADRVKFTVGIVCGHLKSSFYAEMIGWQLGVHPDHLTGLDFRVKIPGKKANEKGVSARSSANGGTNTPPKIVQEIFGTNYGHGYFKYQACDYCDDVLAETADISIGDAWLPEFMSKGTSIAVVRNPRINELVQTGITQKRLKIDSIAADRVADSQDAGLRHRREGLSYRLFLKSKDNQWAPKKRVEPGTST
ncbi:MAG: Coenzyme F420 hydrogenase/dehydrogenase, beta subunit C-terminal domain [Lacunisphaera sp.]